MTRTLDTKEFADSVEALLASDPNTWGLLAPMPVRAAALDLDDLEAVCTALAQRAGMPVGHEPRAYAAAIRKVASLVGRPLTITERRNVNWLRIAHRLFETAPAARLAA